MIFNLNKLKEEQFNNDQFLKERKGRKHSYDEKRVCCSLMPRIFCERTYCKT